MGLVRFLAWSLLGTAIWTGALVWAGYALGRNFERVGEYVDPVSTAVLAAAAAYYLWRVVRHKGAGPATQP
jgi:membrane protein DedA with SNARE-associated domain